MLYTRRLKHVPYSGIRQQITTLWNVAGRRQPETRRSRKGRNEKLRAYYQGVLDRLIAARLEVGLTQRDVSLQMGMSHTYLNKCETGERVLDVAELWALSKIYGKPLSHFAPND